MAQIAAVAVDKATPQFDREYSYLVPDSLPVQVGCRVTVPFGRGTAAGWDLVLSLSESRTLPGSRKSPHWWTVSRSSGRNSSA